jgi:HAD superfamily hydrolase (TIGR01509 family)
VAGQHPAAAPAPEEVIPAMADRPAAVLWDFDGTLVDTEPLWLELERAVLEGLGGTWTPTLADELVGTTMGATAAILLRHAGRPGATAAETAEVADRLEHSMLRLLGEGQVPWQPGAERLLAQLGAAGIPSALVSSSPAAILDAAVRGLPPDVFAAVVAGDQGHEPKPDPAPYLHACARLGVAPAECVVVEDSPTGAAAGAAAGAWVLAVAGVVPVPPGRRRTVVDSLADVDLALLRRLAHTDLSSPGDAAAQPTDR